MSTSFRKLDAKIYKPDNESKPLDAKTKNQSKPLAEVKKNKKSKEKNMKKLLIYHQRLVAEKGLPPSRLMLENTVNTSIPPSFLVKTLS